MRSRATGVTTEDEEMPNLSLSLPSPLLPKYSIETKRKKYTNKKIPLLAFSIQNFFASIWLLAQVCLKFMKC